MINLIPPEGHKAIKREYIYRVGATLCFLFAIVITILTVAFIPTYVLTTAQINALQLESLRESSKDVSFVTADEEVRVTKNILTQLKTATTSYAMSTVINEIQHKAPSTILFKNFTADAPKGKFDKVQVQGVSPTREALARFRSSLEESDMFVKAEVPISDLAKDTDLPFVMTITLANI